MRFRHPKCLVQPEGPSSLVSLLPLLFLPGHGLPHFSNLLESHTVMGCLAPSGMVRMFSNAIFFPRPLPLIRRNYRQVPCLSTSATCLCAPFLHCLLADRLTANLSLASGATVQIILFATLAIELKKKAPNAHTFLEAIRARYGT